MTDPQRMELKNLRESADGPIHSGNYWSHEEKERARQLFNMNFGISEIALELGRGEIATCQQRRSARKRDAAILAAAYVRTAQPILTIASSAERMPPERRCCNV